MGRDENVTNRDAGGMVLSPLELTQARNQAVELFAVQTADGQARTVVQNDDRITMEKGLPFFHAFEIYQDGAAEAKKFFGGEPGLCRPHRFAKQVSGFT